MWETFKAETMGEAPAEDREGEREGERGREKESVRGIVETKEATFLSTLNQ